MTSRWHKHDYTPPEDQSICALHDLEDVDSADTLVLLSLPGGGGGKNVEFGYALAKGKRLLLCGEPRNVFEHLPQVRHLMHINHQKDLDIEDLAALLADS